MNATKRATVGAIVLGSALVSGCVYSGWGAGPAAWGWSAGAGLSVSMSDTPGSAGGHVEIPLRSARGEEFVVVRAGGHTSTTEDLPPGDPMAPPYESVETRYLEDWCISYRRYFGRGEYATAYIRPFFEAGLSVGTTRRTWEDDNWMSPAPAVVEEEELNHLSLGIGIRLRSCFMYPIDDGPLNLYTDCSVNYTSRIGTTLGMAVGWSFGRPSGDSLTLGPGGGMRSAGPRMGMVCVTGEAADQLEAAYGLGPVLSTIGWQFEYQYASSANGPTGLVEFVPLVTGLESELTFLSMNVLFGLRLPTEWEFMAGPYISETGHGMTFAVGKTARAGRMAMPVNLGLTSTREGPRISLTFGWNIGR